MILQTCQKDGIKRFVIGAYSGRSIMALVEVGYWDRQGELQIKAGSRDQLITLVISKANAKNENTQLG